MNSIIFKVLERPDAQLIVETVKLALEKERDLRIKFLDNITDDDRAEFINGKTVKHIPECLKYNEVNGLLLRLLGIYVTNQQIGDIGFGKLMISLPAIPISRIFAFLVKKNQNILRTNRLFFQRPIL